MSKPNGKPTSEPFRFRVMDVKVWTEDVLNSDFLLKSQAVIFTCRVNRRQIRKHVNIKCDSLQSKYSGDFWGVWGAAVRRSHCNQSQGCV